MSALYVGMSEVFRLQPGLGRRVWFEADDVSFLIWRGIDGIHVEAYPRNRETEGRFGELVVRNMDVTSWFSVHGETPKGE